VADPERTRGARAAAERALVRVGHHYGETPEAVSYASQLLVDHPELDEATARADSVLAVDRFVTQLSG
jgi:hypothetical protein